MTIKQIKQKYIQLLKSVSDLDIEHLINLYNIQLSDLQLSYLVEWSIVIRNKQKHKR